MSKPLADALADVATAWRDLVMAIAKEWVMRVSRFLARFRSRPFAADYAVHYRVAGGICCGAARGISSPSRANVTCPACRQAIPITEERA